MYSLILMTAMAGSADTTAFNGRLLRGSCHGCYGSTVSSCYGCSGSSCSGCTGCYGSSCHGGVFGSRIWGASCHGCWGSSCYGSSCMGSSCHGSSCRGSSCHGGCMGSVPYGVSYYEGEVISIPTVGTVKLETDDKESANIRIELPAGAKLFVEGVAVDTTTGQFHTPPLPKGRTFYYDMKAEAVVDGKTVVEEKKVVVKAGETVVEKFGKLTTVASK